MTYEKQVTSKVAPYAIGCGVGFEPYLKPDDDDPERFTRSVQVTTSRKGARNIYDAADIFTDDEQAALRVLMEKALVHQLGDLGFTESEK